MGWRARTWPGEGVMLEVAWVGVDVGKAHHWVVAEDPQVRVVLSRKVANDQQEIARVVAEVGKLAGRLVWTRRRPFAVDPAFQRMAASTDRSAWHPPEPIARPQSTTSSDAQAEQVRFRMGAPTRRGCD